MKIALYLLLLIVAQTINGATLCVGPSATGSGNGSDWNNQLQWSSATLVRGNTYYLADGSYGGKTLSIAASGTTLITIKKATVGDATVEAIAGWVSTMGDGQVTFTGGITISTSYWDIDGVKGGGWSGAEPDKTTANYGFFFDAVTIPWTINADVQRTDVTISHAAGVAPTADVLKSWCTTDGSDQGIDNLVLRYCYAYGYNSFQWGNAGGTHNDWVTEYCIMEDIYVTATNHGEQFHNSFGFINGWHIRYCWVDGVRSGSVAPTMIIGALNESSGPYWVYGCVFKDLSYTDGGICAVQNGQGTHSLNGGVFNNTFINCNTTGINNEQIVGGAGNNSMDAQNNLFVEMEVDEGISGTWSHQAYWNDEGRPGTDSNAQVLGADPFVDYAGEDYQLETNTSAGVTTPFTTDVLGNDYNGSGTWSRGAFAFVAQGGGEGVSGAIATAIPGAGQVRGRRFSP